MRSTMTVRAGHTRIIGGSPAEAKDTSGNFWRIAGFAPTVWAGWLVSGLGIFLLLADAFGKLTELAPVVQGTARLGYPTHLVFAIGVIELLCVVTYATPRTAVLGAILLTGYLGGGVATHVRIEDPVWTHVLAPVYMAIVIWGGLWLRESRLRILVPVRRRLAAA
jgi:hypothetical protein